MYKETKGSRFYIQTPSPPINKAKIQKAIQKESKEKIGLTNHTITAFLQHFPHFLGCFAEDELQTIVIRSLPVSLIVNFDHSGLDGSHWIALRIDKKRLEIFDPLGFNVMRWPRIPFFLIDFLHKFSLNRKVFISREIQPFNSSLCGFYCIYFLYCRTSTPFSSCIQLFSLELHNNDNILINLFNKI